MVVRNVNNYLNNTEETNFTTRKREKFVDLLKLDILEKVKRNGGFVNTHSHLDRAYTVTLENFHLANATLQEKWYLVDSIKKESTVCQIYDRMAFALDQMLEQGVQAVGTFIDIDEVVEDKCIRAAQMVREQYKSDIKIKFINQTLKGVIDPEARKWFDIGSQFVDIIGGLPKKDAGHEDEHLDILMETAKKMNKPIHVHVDQFNTQSEKETEQLIDKTVQHKMQGKVTAIHSISLAAHPIEYREKIYKKMKDAGVMLITCPTAWIDGRRSEELAPIHNSIAPVEELVAYGVSVAIGTDNISDILKPFTDGDMWTELRFLLESCRFYEIEELAKIATVNGLKVLNIN